MTIADDLRAAVNWLYGDEHDALCKRLLAHADTIERVIESLDDTAYTLNTSLLDESIKALTGEPRG